MLSACAPTLIELDRTISVDCKPTEHCWPTPVSEGLVLDYERLKSENTVLKKDLRDCQASQNRR